MNIQKKEKVFLFIVVLAAVILISIPAVVAQETDTQVGADTADLFSEFADAELEVEAGTTPDSFFYFLDSFFDRFGDEIQVREEKIAEIREMIKQGKIDEARVALERYRGYADFLEEEVDPDNREEALRSAAAIRNAITELEDEIPETDRADFVDDVLDREERIASAVEIAGKIKELCQALSKLDPLEYSRVCRTDDSSPDWQRRLDRDLTDQQREEAINFGRIMQQCFETSGQQCACEEIPFAEFAQTCSIAAPLAVACDINGNEEACEQLDDLEMPELPPHLQDVFDNLERDISESQFELHQPRECREAGATSPRECMRIMVQTHAPEECREALIEANPESEREAREICERIMFDLYAPEECIEEGITDHRDCGVLTFQRNAPQECIDAGLTGEHQSDHRKCEQIIKGVEGKGIHRPAPALGARCREIQNSQERLACYDGAIQGTHDFGESYRETREAERQCAERCSSQGGAWDFSNGNCECHFREDFEEDFRSQEEEIAPEESQTTGEETIEPIPEQFSETTTEKTETETTEPSTTDTTTEEPTTSTNSASTTPSSDTTTETGAFITGNSFLRYRYR